MVLDTIGRVLAEVVDGIQDFFSKTGQTQKEQSAAQIEKLLRGEEVNILDFEAAEENPRGINVDPEGFNNGLFELLGELPEESQELIIEQVNPEAVEEDTDIREALQTAEGGAVSQAAAVLTGTLSLETLSGGQLESQQFILSQILTFLALENVLGLELETVIEEGVTPGLQREINQEYREQNVDLQDAVEEQLRNKEGDSDYLSDLGIYGIRPGDVSTLEEVAIRQIEPEELIETPAEAGVIPSEELVQEELDRTGLSEGAKELFLETVRELPKTTRIYEERIRAEELVNQLDELTAAEELTPEEALERLGFLREGTQQELLTRFQDLQELPSGPPTRSQVENGFTNGLIGIDRYTTLLEVVDVDPAEHPYVPQEAILSEIDGDLRQAVGLGLIDESEYTELAETAGLDDEVVARLLVGEDLDDIAEDRLQTQVGEANLPVDTISGIGPARSRALEAFDISTVENLSAETPGEVTNAINVSESTAEELIRKAQILRGDI